MKAKKIIVLLTAMCMLFGLVACGDNENSDTNDGQAGVVENQESSNGETENNIEEETTEITMEALLEYEVSPESDFSCTGDETTGAIINVYEGNSEIVVIPEKIDGLPVTKIDGYVFTNKSPVKAVKLADSVEVIGESVFGLNKNLEIVLCGVALETIENYAFQNCESLKEVQLNEGIKSIGRLAFSGCKALESIYIPASVDTIEAGAFMWCNENLIIQGKSGSYAETFAIENEITFEAVD